MTEDEEDYGTLIILAGVAKVDLVQRLYCSSLWPFCGEIGWLKRGEFVMTEDQRHCYTCRTATTQVFNRVENRYWPEWQCQNCGRVARDYTEVVTDEMTMEGEG